MLNYGYLTPLAEDPSSPALALRGLTRRFGDHIAVDNLSLDVPRGSFYGLVGPNGAGKTTALTMATGLLRPTAGDAWVCGHCTWGSEEEALAAKRCYGLLADGLPVFDRLSGKEFLDYTGRLRQLPEAEVEKRSTDLLRVLELPQEGGKYIADYSAGMTKKILLAAALLHRPDILILDEPFEAVDPVSAQVIREILRSYVRSGGTVLMSSHVMALVEEMCDRVAIVNAGNTVAAGTLEEVRGSRDSLTDVFVDLVGGGHLDQDALGWLAESDAQ